MTAWGCDSIPLAMRALIIVEVTEAGFTAVAHVCPAHPTNVRSDLNPNIETAKEEHHWSVCKLLSVVQNVFAHCHAEKFV